MTRFEGIETNRENPTHATVKTVDLTNDPIWGDWNLPSYLLYDFFAKKNLTNDPIWGDWNLLTLIILILILVSI